VFHARPSPTKCDGIILSDTILVRSGIAAAMGVNMVRSLAV
jgi:hypothetical protein